MFETVLEFTKLEKIEFGGIKGKILSSQTLQIFDEFNELYKVFQEKSYDCLDPKDKVCFTFKSGNLFNTLVLTSTNKCPFIIYRNSLKITRVSRHP